MTVVDRSRGVFPFVSSHAWSIPTEGSCVVASGSAEIVSQVNGDGLRAELASRAYLGPGISLRSSAFGQLEHRFRRFLLTPGAKSLIFEKRTCYHSVLERE